MIVLYSLIGSASGILPCIAIEVSWYHLFLGIGNSQYRNWGWTRKEAKGVHRRQESGMYSGNGDREQEEAIAISLLQNREENRSFEN